MATMTVWRFADAEGAERADDILVDLAGRKLITVHDAATVSWPEGAKRPKTKQARSLTGAGALGGSFWGLLFGIIFFMPLLGVAVGAALGALAGSLSDAGISDDFIAGVREKVTPGTSALFLLSSDAVLDAVRGAFAGEHPELLETNLTEEQERNLREAFGDD